MVEPRDQRPDSEQPQPAADSSDVVQPSDAEPIEQAEAEEGGIGNTVGTGTSIALGCIAGTILLVVIGLIFLLVVMVLS